ncbi:hypothetical protein EDB81DRAFT_89547 [Dactylonectria macrodidyma]|uniref:Uncharacterized protein n=1 Tax=Dactylonectria macrodidyma TaxID=307937 RepID=A0A9P9E8X3_9HYPO|nr:hypothetical protein EDB81DRAFT_89547 [Dactylonectria macrodidyma]
MRDHKDGSIDASQLVKTIVGLTRSSRSLRPGVCDRRVFPYIGKADIIQLQVHPRLRAIVRWLVKTVNLPRAFRQRNGDYVSGDDGKSLNAMELAVGCKSPGCVTGESAVRFTVMRKLFHIEIQESYQLLLTTSKVSKMILASFFTIYLPTLFFPKPFFTID